MGAAANGLREILDPAHHAGALEGWGARFVPPVVLPLI
jgi:hypothetical protein